MLRKACPALTDELVAAMKRAPMRGFDPSILKEPHIYRCNSLSAVVYMLMVQLSLYFAHDQMPSLSFLAV